MFLHMTFPQDSYHQQDGSDFPTSWLLSSKTAKAKAATPLNTRPRTGSASLFCLQHAISQSELQGQLSPKREGCAGDRLHLSMEEWNTHTANGGIIGQLS